MAFVPKQDARLDQGPFRSHGRLSRMRQRHHVTDGPFTSATIRETRNHSQGGPAPFLSLSRARHARCVFPRPERRAVAFFSRTLRAQKLQTKPPVKVSSRGSLGKAWRSECPQRNSLDHQKP